MSGRTADPGRRLRRHRGGRRATGPAGLQARGRAGRSQACLRDGAAQAVGARRPRNDRRWQSAASCPPAPYECALPHGWIAVDPGTLATSHARVYAIGDVTLIPLASGLPLPKAGVMAELQGLRVARAIAAEISGAEPPPPFDGTGYCPIELGTRSAARVDGDWYARPEPVVTIDGPSAERADEKAEFERDHLARWFDG